MKFRYARHTNNLQEITDFYTAVLNFKVLGSFENHDGYDGVFLGKEGLDWHLEFTSDNSEATHHFNEDDALVFYPTSREEYSNLLANFKAKKVNQFEPKNSYWKTQGIMVKDPDGCPIIISQQKVTS